MALSNIMQNKGYTFGETIIALMKKHNADSKSIAAYQAKCSKELGEKFNDLLT